MPAELQHSGCGVQGTELQRDFTWEIQANASTEREARRADVVSIKKEETQYSLQVVVGCCLNKASSYRITFSFFCFPSVS